MKLSAPIWRNTMSINGCNVSCTVYPESNARHLRVGGLSATRASQASAIAWLQVQGVRSAIARALTTDPAHLENTIPEFL